MSIASNSPPLATCAHPASPTCLLPSWVIRSALRKEQPDEYSIERNTRVFPRFADERFADERFAEERFAEERLADKRLASGLPRRRDHNSAILLVRASRTVGVSFHL